MRPSTPGWRSEVTRPSCLVTAARASAPFPPYAATQRRTSAATSAREGRASARGAARAGPPTAESAVASSEAARSSADTGPPGGRRPRATESVRGAGETQPRVPRRGGEATVRRVPEAVGWLSSASLLVANWVFVVTNVLILLDAVVGLVIVLHHRRRARAAPAGT